MAMKGVLCSHVVDLTGRSAVNKVATLSETNLPSDFRRHVSAHDRIAVKS